MDGVVKFTRGDSLNAHVGFIIYFFTYVLLFTDTDSAKRKGGDRAEAKNR